MICPGPSQPAPRAACAHEIVQTIPVRRRGDSQQRADHLDLRVRRTSLPWRLGAYRSAATRACGVAARPRSVTSDAALLRAGSCCVARYIEALGGRLDLVASLGDQARVKT